MSVSFQWTSYCTSVSRTGGESQVFWREYRSLWGRWKFILGSRSVRSVATFLPEETARLQSVCCWGVPWSHVVSKFTCIHPELSCRPDRSFAWGCASDYSRVKVRSFCNISFSFQLIVFLWLICWCACVLNPFFSSGCYFRHSLWALYFVSVC